MQSCRSGTPLLLLARDHDSDASSMEVVPDLSPAISHVSDYPIRRNPGPSSPHSLHRSCLHERLEDALLVPLTCCDQDSDWLAASLCPHVDLGAEATFAAAQCFVRMPRVFGSSCSHAGALAPSSRLHSSSGPPQTVWAQRAFRDRSALGSLAQRADHCIRVLSLAWEARDHLPVHR
jgi:hypothetical protein